MKIKHKIFSICIIILIVILAVLIINKDTQGTEEEIKLQINDEQVIFSVEDPRKKEELKCLIVLA